MLLLTVNAHYFSHFLYLKGKIIYFHYLFIIPPFSIIIGKYHTMEARSMQTIHKVKTDTKHE